MLLISSSEAAHIFMSGEFFLDINDILETLNKITQNVLIFSKELLENIKRLNFMHNGIKIES